jgi:N-methylhydantoinase A
MMPPMEQVAGGFDAGMTGPEEADWPTDWVVGVDVGGTFTDFYGHERSSGRNVVHKRPSTPGNPALGILAGLDELRRRFDIPAASLKKLSHGTTVATNALIERRGGNVALIVTEGFRDLLEIGRQVRPLIYDFQTDHPAPLVDRTRRFEARERMTRGGHVVTELSDAEIARLVDQVAGAGVDACAICFLFAFANPAHERRLADALRAALPQLHVSASSEVQPEFREYERLSTTVLNAYLQPVMAEYLLSLETWLAEQAPAARLGVNQSNGGLISAARARLFPIRTALSGPAAGIAGAIHTARVAGEPDIITLDMGGTSADVCLIRDYKAETAHERWIEGYPARLASLDINAVGAGGGSIAWVDTDGLLKVGPRSAGAVPGPACYGRGGTLPTVSDANLVLGRLSAEGLLDGSMPLDVEASRRALAALAERIGLSLEHTALGILDIVVANMVRAVRTVSVERGFDPRRFTLLPFGGAGPLHAVAVARALGIGRILVPANPGLLCAEGLLISDQREDFVRSVQRPLDAASLASLDAVLASLRVEAESWYAAEEIEPVRRSAAVAIDLRCVGQNFELAVAVTPEKLGDEAALRADFIEAHRRAYGFEPSTQALEIVNLRLVATGKTDAAFVDDAASSDAGEAEPHAIRTVWFERAGPVETKIYRRAALGIGQCVVGPAVIEQLDATILVHPGDCATVLPGQSLLIEAAP